MLVGGSCDWTRLFGCEGAPNLLFPHTQWLERHEITIHPVRSAIISPTQMIFTVKFIKHLLVPGLELFLMFFCLISRCSTFLFAAWISHIFLGGSRPQVVSWWSSILVFFFPSPFPGNSLEDVPEGNVGNMKDIPDIPTPRWITNPPVPERFPSITL